MNHFPPPGPPAALTAGVASRAVAPDERAALLAVVHTTLHTHPALAPRTPTELARAHDTGHLLLATTPSGELAGWLLRIPYGDSTTQELAGLYVRPDFRGRGAVRLLFEAALPEARTSLCVTTSPQLARHLTDGLGFWSTGLLGLSGAQRRGLLADRFRPARLGALLAAGPVPGRPVLLRHDTPAQTETCPGCRRPVDDRRAFTAADLAFGTGIRSRYATCEHCGHLRQLNAGPGDPAAPVAFSEPQLPFVAKVMDSAAVSHLVYRPRARWLARRSPLGPGSRVLDVGCGTGGFLAHVSAASGASCQGVEADPALAALARDRGITTHHTDFRDFETSDRFDAITLFHVLEHLADPEAVLRRAAGLLAPDGVLCVETPVTGGLAARIFGPRWFPLLPPFHRHIPSRASLAATLGRACAGARVTASCPVYLPGEYAASAALLFEAALPHPHQRRRLHPAAACAGSAGALAAAALALPLEAASAALHRLLPLAGHHRVLLRKQDSA